MTLLTRTEASLPGSWYYDPDRYARELDAVWYRDWVCVGRQEEIPGPGDYRLAEIGSQRPIVTRDNKGAPRVFHNTCRHRGSTLCETPHRLVIEQDGRACELNQQGLKSRRHQHGVLVPQEYALWEFHEWLRMRLGRD